MTCWKQWIAVGACSLRGRQGYGEFAFRMKGFHIPDWRESDRRFPHRSEDLGAHIDAADVYEAARSEMQATETLTIGP